MKSRATWAGIGLAILAVLAIVALLPSSAGSGHPLASETEFDLCGLLGEDIWVELSYPASDPVARVPANAEGGTTVCALELDPVPPGDRFARVARGDDADEIRRIATVRLVTTAHLQATNPEATTGTYVDTFRRELASDGWEADTIQGPWSWGQVYTMAGEQAEEGVADRAATLVEDAGAVLWTTATGVAPDNLVRFTQSATNRIRRSQ